MLKLLTEEEKKKVAREYGRRRAIVMLSAFIFVLVTGIIGLLPSYVLSNARQKETMEQAKIIDVSGQRGDEAELQRWLSGINAKLHTLSPELDADRPSDFIDEVVSRQIAGIRLDSFMWTRSGESVMLSVNGTASDRQALIAFNESVGSSGRFSGLSLPISNLAQDRNISFQMSFLLAQTP